MERDRDLSHRGRRRTRATRTEPHGDRGRRRRRRLRGVRASTTDVDTIYELDDELRGVVATVAARHGLEPDWLNDRARPWRPVTFDPATCDTLLQTGGLHVLAPPLDIVVLMKISAGGRTPNDALDLRALWPATGPDEAVAAFYAAYPHEEPDPYLADWIRSVIAG